MTVYGADTGNYSAASILAARRAHNASAGDQILKGKFVNNTGGTNNYTNGNNQNSESDLYALQERKRLQALESARKSGLRSLAAEQKTVDPYYNKAISTVSGQSATGARNLAEYMAQRGQTTSGVSAQAALTTAATLNNNVTGLETERANTLADIAERKTQVQNAYDQGALEAATDRQIAETEAVQNAQAAQAQYQAELEQLGYKNDLAKDLASYKANLDLNNSLAEIQARFKTSASLKAMGGSGLSGSGSSKIPKPTLTYSQAVKLYDNGTKTQNVLDAIKYYTGGVSNIETYKEIGARLDSLSVPSSKVALIETYNKQGKLTDAEAMALLKKYGLAR